MDKKIQSLLTRLNKAREAYRKASEDGNRRVANMGWGYGMRCVKMPKFTKEDNARDRVRKIEHELTKLGYTNF